jgi:hypothetical protein
MEAHVSGRIWPKWWDWELELSPHLLKRMVDRRFTEVELRQMFEKATGYREDIVDGRWVIETKHNRRAWEVIVEPDDDFKVQVAVTAYPVWRGK